MDIVNNLIRLVCTGKIYRRARSWQYGVGLLSEVRTAQNKARTNVFPVQTEKKTNIDYVAYRFQI